MSFLFGAKLPTAILLVIIFYLLCAGQALHTLLVMCRRDTRGAWIRACYELLLFFHLVMGAATAANRPQNRFLSTGRSPTMRPV